MNPLLLACLLLLACGDKEDDTGAAGDGGSSDGGAADGGSSDGGAADGGSSDGGAADGGSSDGGAADGGSSDGGGEEAVVHEVDPDTLATWLEEEAAGERDLLLINTHTPYAGEIPGTDLHVAYNSGDELVAAVGADLDRLTVVYCKTGPMSVTASETLVAAGYTAIYDLPGGMSAWEAAGYTLDE